MTKEFKIGLIGYGTVGAGVVQLLTERKNEIRRQWGTSLRITALCDRSLHKKKIPLKSIFLTRDYKKLLSYPDLDCVVELIGGLNPAKTIAFETLKRKRHFVTANKELIAHQGQAIFRAAREAQCLVGYESSVMAGVPVLRTLAEGLAGNRCRGLYGIINGTCNFILTEMAEKNMTFDESVAEAQKRGFAESDPTLDINGMDCTHKLTILVALAMKKFVPVKKIPTEGITMIRRTDIEFAREMGYRVKLLAIAKQHRDGLDVRVHPTLIDQSHPLAQIKGIMNALFLETDPLGDLLLSGEGAGSLTAASGVVSDLINCAVRTRESAPSSLLNTVPDVSEEFKLKPLDEVKTKFYIRLNVTDRPGVLSRITGILGKHDISIHSLYQRAHNRLAQVPIIMMTEAAPERRLRKALDKIHALDVVRSRPVAIRIENLHDTGTETL